jgi:type IV pilus assembly protein PilC
VQARAREAGELTVPLFTYEAVTDAGLLERGELEVAHEAELERTLDRRHLSLVRARRRRIRRTSGPRIRARDLAELARYVAITCRGGLPLVDSLDDFAQQATSPALKSVLTQVLRDVRDGLSLSDAMARHPRAFDEGVLALTRAGEASGHMEEVMRRMAEQLEFQLDVKSKVKGALIYPCVLGCAVTGLVVLLITFLLPRIVGMLAQNNATLPTPTLVLLAISDFVTSHALALTGGVVATVVAARAFVRTKVGAVLFDRLVIATPALGALARMGAEARFVSTLRTLLSSGCEAVSALDMSADACGAPSMAARLRGASAKLREGTSFSEALGATRLLHPLVLRMVQLGERSGRMDEALATCVDHFGAEVPKRVRRTISILEPTIVCVAGFVVAFVLLATLMPVFTMYATT